MLVEILRYSVHAETDKNKTNKKTKNKNYVWTYIQKLKSVTI